MIVLENKRLTDSFLNANAVPNLRALLKEAFPNLEIRSRSLSGLVQRLKEFDDDIEISVTEFRNAIWELMEGDSPGAVHIGLLDATDFFAGQDRQARVRWARTQWIVPQAEVVETGVVLDARLVDDSSTTSMQVLYLGEADAEIPEPDMNATETVNGTTYVYKAYRLASVPVISMIDISSSQQPIRITTRPIHRSVRPVAEIAHLQEQLSETLKVKFSPLPGVGEGINALWGNRIAPRRYVKEGTDSAKVSVTVPKGRKNADTRTVERSIEQWDLTNGSLVFDKHVSFVVDVAKATFSFAARVTNDQANEVIQAILGETDNTV